jgi:hypothetical protein
MATPPQEGVLAVTFTIVTPLQDDAVTADGASSVSVQVNSLDMQNTRFRATITDISSSTVVGTQDLAQEGNTSRWSNPVGVGVVPSSIPTTNNRTVTIQAFQGIVAGDSDSNDFKAWSSGSNAGN